MRSCRILSCLARNIALPLLRSGSPCRCFRTLSRSLQNLPEQRHNLCRSEIAVLSHSFTTSTPARSPTDRPAGSPDRGATRDGTAPLPLPEHARHVLRHVADSVVVCTAHSQHIVPTTGSTTGGTMAVPVGLTMSSFAPLSLFPNPVITFNIAVPSRTETVIAKTRHFMIHILSGDVQGARLADVFRAGNAHPANTLRELQRSGSEVIWSLGAPGFHQDEEQPFLRGAGVLYVLRCKLLDEPLGGLVPVRDHVVVLGEILEIIEGEAEATDSIGAPRFGLLYGDRHYRQLSGAVMRTSSGQ